MTTDVHFLYKFIAPAIPSGRVMPSAVRPLSGVSIFFGLWYLWSAAIAERNKAHSLAGLGCAEM